MKNKLINYALNRLICTCQNTKHTISFSMLILFFVGLSHLHTINAQSINLPKIFSDHMVLQRNHNNLIWGTTLPNSKINILVGDTTISAIADAQGNFEAELPKLRVGQIDHITINSDNDTIVINDILIGEVWLASGQSNMNYSFSSLPDGSYQDEIENCEDEDLRILTVEKISSDTLEKDILTKGWKSANNKNIMKFSAVSYFFAKELRKKYGVPIGIINSSFGGSAIERWISREKLEEFEKYRNIFIELDNYVESPEEIEKEKEKWIMHMKRDFNYELIDQNEWKTLNAPETFEKNLYPEKDGFFWLQKTVNIPISYAENDIDLHLAAIDDLDFLFFNDKYIGNDGPWDKIRHYIIPKELIKKGPNTITIGVVDFASNGGFHGDPNLLKIAQGDKQISLANQWKCFHAVDKTNVPPIPQSKKSSMPGGLFYGMLEPIIPYGIKGIIWYQGEADARTFQMAKDYEVLFPTLISDWRERWDQNLPFIFVQLPNYKTRSNDPSEESEWSELRQAQAQALDLENTAMAITIDIGEAKEVHPANKLDVGKRLALGAMKVAYEENIVYSGPVVDSFMVNENHVIVKFKNIGDGLFVKGEELKGFAIAGKDGKFFWSDKADIDGDAVVVSSKKVNHPFYIKYAWGNNPECNLYNEEMLPAAPFKLELKQND